MTGRGLALTDPVRRTRRAALVRVAASAPYATWVLVLWSAIALLWLPVWLFALACARTPDWWWRLAWLTARTGARTRAFTWLLTDQRPKRNSVASRASVVLLAPPRERLSRRSLLARLGFAPWWMAVRWSMGWLGRAVAVAAWVCRVSAGRDPRSLRGARLKLQAYCTDADCYLLLLSRGRPRLPEPDPRLRRGVVPGPEMPPLPTWPRRLGWIALGVDVGAFILAGFALIAGDSTVVLFFADCLVQGFIPLVGIYIVAQAGPLRVEQFGLHALHPWRSLGWAVLVIASILFILATLLMLFAPALADQSNDNAIVPDGSGLAWELAFLALATVVAPIFEEFFFRGIVFQAFRGKGTWAAATGSSFMFALGHFDINPIALVDRTILGIGLCWLFARTGRLLPGMFAHSINNAVVVPLGLGWDWAIAVTVPGSLLVIAIIVKLLSRRTGDWSPVDGPLRA